MKLPVELTIDAICEQYLAQRESVPRDPTVEDDSRLASLRGGAIPVSRFDGGIEEHES